MLEPKWLRIFPFCHDKTLVMMINRPMDGREASPTATHHRGSGRSAGPSVGLVVSGRVGRPAVSVVLQSLARKARSRRQLWMVVLMFVLTMIVSILLRSEMPNVGDKRGLTLID